MTRTILITGGAGYIGSQLIHDLATDERFADCTIRIYDNMGRETYHALLGLPPTGRYEFIEGDVLDNAGVRRALQDVWAVVHMAAVVRTPLSFGPAGWLEQVNHWGTANLAEAAQAAGVEAFIYTSSASVYGPIYENMQAYPFRESDIPRPVGLYAESKRRAEHHLLAMAGLNPIILRLGTIFGYAPAARYDAVANRFAYLAGVNRSVTVNGDGSQMRPQLHVRDASAAIRFALMQASSMGGEIFNAVGENASVADLAAAVTSAKPEAKIHYTEQDVLVHLAYAADPRKLNERGWYAEVSIEAGLSELVAQFHGYSG